MGDFLKAVVVFAVAFALFTFPATWLLMLFLGTLLDTASIILIVVP